MMDFDTDTIESLIAYLRGDLSSEETNEIEQRLNEDEGLRKILLELSVEEAALTEWAQTEQVAARLDDGAFADDEGPKSILPFPKTQAKTWLVAAAAVTLLVTAIVRFKGDPAIPSGVAQLVASTDANWHGAAPKLKAPLAAGGYQLDQGSIDLLFDDGAKVSLSGPVVFELKSSRHIHLTSGNLVARIPDEALGFIVTSPRSEVVDLGTEFGLSVNDAGNTDVHVLDGLVEVLDEDDPGVLIEAGKALRFASSSENDPVEIPVESREGLLGISGAENKGIKMLRGSVRIAESLSAEDLRKHPSGPNQIDLITEQIEVTLAVPLEVTIQNPGSYREFSGANQVLPAGTKVTSYLLHFRPGSKDPVFGVIRFDQPIVGILSNGSHLSQSDELFGVPTVFYPKGGNPYRGLEPVGQSTGKGRDSPDWQPDEIILSQDQQTIAIRTAANTARGYDQIRILTLTP